jgi:hypothetical protein
MGSLVLAVLLVLLNIPAYWLLGRFLFPTGADVLDTIRLLFTPRLWDLLQGEAFEDQWAHAKVGAWLFLCVSLVASEHYFLRHHVPGLVTSLGGWWSTAHPAH